MLVDIAGDPPVLGLPLFCPTTVMVAAYAEVVTLPLRNIASLQRVLIISGVYEDLSRRCVKRLKNKAHCFGGFNDHKSVRHVSPILQLCVDHDTSAVAP